MDRAEKREFVTGLNSVFQRTGSVVVAHYAGLTVAQMNEFRSKMRVAGGTVKVAKNRLAKIALQGTDTESMQALFNGQTLICYSDDPVVAPKVASPRPQASLRALLEPIPKRARRHEAVLCCSRNTFEPIEGLKPWLILPKS